MISCGVPCWQSLPFCHHLPLGGLQEEGGMILGHEHLMGRLLPPATVHHCEAGLGAGFSLGPGCELVASRRAYVPCWILLRCPS